MNKPYYLLLAGTFMLIAAASCQKAVDEEGPTTVLQHLTITAGLENGGTIPVKGEEVIPETKTIRNADLTVWWTPGDAISLFYGSGTDGGSIFTSTNTTNVAKTQFTGDIEVITGSNGSVENDISFWGVYPYNAENSCSGDKVTLRIPIEQFSSEETFSPGQWPTVGKSTALAMSFKNVACGYKFKVQNEGITALKVSDNKGYIAGYLDVGMGSDGNPILYTTLSPTNGKTVIVKPKDSECFKPGVYYYVVLKTNAKYPNFSDYTEGITWTFYTSTQHATYTCDLSGTEPEYPKTRGVFKVMDNKDSGLTWESGGDRELYYDIHPDEVLSGEFSVSSTKKVRFSKGNLQAKYDGTSYCWGFADRQYDYIGDAVGNTTITSQRNGGIVDLFGWSTPSTNYGISVYSSSEAFKDWGLAIDGSGIWRTLSSGEWNYLFYFRANASDKYGLGRIVEKVGDELVIIANGLIILPDTFVNPDPEKDFCPISSSRGLFDYNSFSVDKWTAMDEAGAVFLPAAGCREVNIVSSTGTDGIYWSSSHDDDITATFVRFSKDHSNLSFFDIERNIGCSVRLVTDVK